MNDQRNVSSSYHVTYKAKDVRGSNIHLDPISSSTLLSTAQNLSSHSSAPISVLMAPQDKAQYMPWPTEGAMRSGILFMMGGSMSGVGDIGKIGDGTYLPSLSLSLFVKE